jgi:MinD-like ATPase involved in chromosome partitioning or flagellar assembly
MYVTTFYSYKGGVGRTLALVNVAYELAASGQKVLVVDFDLEAPAIHSGTWRGSGEEPRHEEGRAHLRHAGIVEYVGRFIDTMRGPRAENHIVDATPTGCAGKIALMPSGLLNDDYGRRLGAIDWNELYLEYDGYVMFEDLREQWRLLGYDYVLLDSRTGVTDVGGICTRHLPDAVVLIFRPDDQSLEGTAVVADAIRNERPAPGRDRVRLHFVMAAIPDVDDEDGILEDLQSRFQRRLNIPSGELIEIRNYQSMDLLRQPIYTEKRPRTQLARSYQELTKRIRSENIDDREGVLECMRRIYRDMEGTRIMFGSDAVAGYYFEDDLLDSHAEMRDRLAKIEEQYPEDPEVLFALACTYGKARQAGHVKKLLDRRSTATALSPDRLIELARVLGPHTYDGAVRAIELFFREPHAGVPGGDTVRLVFSGLLLLEKLDKDRAGFVGGSPIVSQLSASQQATVASHLKLSRRERAIAAELLANALRGAEGSEHERSNWERELAFARIAVGKFGKAADYYRSISTEDPPSFLPKAAAFCLGLATWGDTGAANRGDFLRVLKAYREADWEGREEDSRDEPQRNMLDCIGNWQAMSLVEWFGGRSDHAHRYLREAEGEAQHLRFPLVLFSCWSYTCVSAETFLEHCHEIRRLLDGCDVRPAFMRDAEKGVA